MSRRILRAFLASASVRDASLFLRLLHWSAMSAEGCRVFPEISASEAQRLVAEWFSPESVQADVRALDSERLGQLRCLSALEAAGVDCRSLATIGTKQLNDVFRQLDVPQAVRKLVKRRRRTIKNRGYARDRRDRLSAEEALLVIEIDDLRRQTRQVEALYQHLSSLPPAQLEEVLRQAEFGPPASDVVGRPP